MEPERKSISQMLIGLGLNPSDQVLEFDNVFSKVSEIEEFKSISPETSRIALSDIIEEAKSKRRKYQKYLDQFRAAIEEKVTTVETTWDQVHPLISREDWFQKVSKDDQVKIFIERIEELRQQSGMQMDSDEEGALSESEYTVKEKFLKHEASNKRTRSRSSSISRSRSRSRKRYRRA
eukprot:TRINITY_DN33772_c0_g1_i2.p1 TRINITY_DN33772_c0_g1~~TRINITY_DN33772_c0_g1_i2.p1  ORF type:complete len:178 (-),score=42.05 TRINITY_DN33772_c0_g1_i2:700-1233(-)